MKKTLLIISCFFFTASYAQVGVTIYNFQGMGIAFPVHKRVFGELKAFSNMYLPSMRAEAAICVNIKKTETLNVYCGAGVVIVPLAGEFKRVSIPVGLQIAPFEHCKNLCLVLEAAPEIYEDVYLRSLWGFRYNF